MRLLSFFVISVITLISCQEDKTIPLVELNLLQYGVPVIVMAPDSAKVKTIDLVMVKDVTIKGNDNYSVQIFYSEARSNNVMEVKADQLAGIREHPLFSRIVEEYDDGFVYETKVDSTRVNHGFRYILIKGDKEYVFQTGLLGLFSLEDVKKMYGAVKQKG